MKSRCLCGLMISLFLSGTIRAQVSTSRIEGTVLDQTGAAIPGAKVTAKNEGTNVSYAATTTEAGTYGFPSLIVGSYTVAVEVPGFKKWVSTKNILTVGAPLVVDAKLEVGALTSTVQVESTFQRLETTNATLGDVRTHREVVELPLNGRNPLSLITLEPGLVQRTNNASGSGTHVFGSRDRAHNVTVDGIDANESSVPNPQSNILRLTPDNVQEYRVVTHNATPEFGRNSGANVVIATRSGSNDFHGDVFWFHRNTALNANEWFNNASGQPRPVLLLHQFGADVGGPIKKDKTFFFWSYQDNRISQTEPISATFGTPSVYTATAKAGLFRFVRGTINIGGAALTANSPQLVDASGSLKAGVPVCGGSVTNNCVDTYNIANNTNDPLGIGLDPKIQALLNTFPLPNTFSVGDGLNTGGFLWNPPSRFAGPFNMLRIDHRFNDNNNIFGRFNWSDYDTTQGDFLNSRPSVFPGFPPMGEVFRANQNLALSYRHTFSPNLVNEFTTGFNRFRFQFTFGESNPNFGDFTKVPPYAQQCVGRSFVNIDTPYCDTPHTRRAVSTLQFIDNLTYVRGAHTMRTGINFRFYRHNDSRGLAGGLNVSPTIIFDQTRRAGGFLNLPTQIDSTDSDTLQQAIVELAGIPARVRQAFPADLSADSYPPNVLQVLGTRAKQFDSYFQDEWRIRRDLTMTYGVRWEVNLPMSDGGGRTFVPDKPIDSSQGPVTYVRADKWYQRNNVTALAPRLSFAWNPGGGKTVVRAGYGIAFDTISTFQVTAVGGKVPGSILDCQLLASSTNSTITSGCTIPPGTNQRIAGGFPTQLPAPTAKPSQAFAQPAQPFNVAPNVGAFDPNLKVPTVHEWNVTIQRELPKGFVTEVGYIGKRGTRLLRAYDLNQISINQSGFLQSFLVSQQNIRNGCRADGTGCPAGVAGTPPTLLLQLVSPSFLNSTTTRSNLRTNDIGLLAQRIDGLTGSSSVVSRGFLANYFRPNPQFTQSFYFDSGGDSIYHGLVASVRRRFERGLEFGASYTFSKSIDDMSVDPIGAASGGALSATNSRTPTDVHNFRLDRSRSDFDNRHVFVGQGVFELPFGRGRKWGSNWHGVVSHVLGGWSTTGIFLYESGEPFTINSGRRTQNGFKVSRAQLIGPMPDSSLKSVPGVEGPVLWNVTPSLDSNNCKQVIDTPSFFCIPPPGDPGMGRNVAQGPGFWNFDFGVVKDFSVTERVKLQFRSEFFNLFNHPNFEDPRNATDGSPTLTSKTFAQACCVTSSVPSSATVIAIGEPNRVIQFALKITF